MAERYYTVTGIVNVNQIDLEKLTRAGSSITLTVMARDGKVGSLVIGRGSITWKRHKRSRTLKWHDFSKRMLE